MADTEDRPAHAGPPRRVAVADVVVPEDRADVRGSDADVDTLIESIRALGQLMPIIIRPDNTLVVGRRRLEAHRRAGWPEIDALVWDIDDIDAELAEIDENFARVELTALERAEQLARRRQLFEARSAAAGVDGGSFAADTADRLGVTPTTVRRDLQIADDIAPDVAEMIRGTDIAASQRELLALARLDADAQRAAVRKVLDGEAKTVQEAGGIPTARPKPTPTPKTPPPGADDTGHLGDVDSGGDGGDEPDGLADSIRRWSGADDTADGEGTDDNDVGGGTIHQFPDPAPADGGAGHPDTETAAPAISYDGPRWPVLLADPLWWMLDENAFETFAPIAADDAVAFIVADAGRIADAVAALNTMGFTLLEVAPMVADSWSWQRGTLVGMAGQLVVGVKGTLPEPAAELPGVLTTTSDDGPGEVAAAAVAAAYPALAKVDLFRPDPPEGWDAAASVLPEAAGL